MTMTQESRLVAEMEAELGEGNKKPEVLPKLAQYELTLDWIEAHRGYRKYVAIAGKCWPAFQTVWICTLLCKQPSDWNGYSGIM